MSGACLDCLECVDFRYHCPVGLAPFRRLTVSMSNYNERRLPTTARIARSICFLDGEHHLHPFRVRVLWRYDQRRRTTHGRANDPPRTVQT